MVTPSLPSGTRDFNADTVRKRNFIFQTIRSVFEIYGFEPLETPAMENLETLTGKYGDEGDKLVFKILNNGLSDPKNKQKAQLAFENILLGKTDKNITERALRYDLTIPFARYVAMNHAQLVMPYRRYQMQPVWRADRPQKGRYREFYQCDADVVGSHSLMNELELASIYTVVFEKLGIGIDLKINNRKILAALAERCGGAGNMTNITIAIDKLDKIGPEKVKEELKIRGLTEEHIRLVENYLSIAGSNEEKLETLHDLLGDNENLLQGIREIKFLLEGQPAGHALQTDFTLARGLDYYTGMIFEVKARDVQIGSIGGGGRYDDLTGLFGVPNIPGVGISFGVDRIFDVMDTLSLFPSDVQTGTQVLFYNLGDEESKVAYQLMQQLRNRDIRCELYPEQVHIDKQFKYANRKSIRYIISIGSKELQTSTCVFRDLITKKQESIAQSTLAAFDFFN